MNLIHVILPILLTASCFPKSSDVKVQVTAKTPDGEPIAEASILIDKATIGETNAFGTFTTTFKAEQTSRHRIEIKKNGETYYFAPHFETVVVPKSKEFTWNVWATMYMAPKPKLKPEIDEVIDKGMAETETPKKESILDNSPFILNIKPRHSISEYPSLRDSKTVASTFATDQSNDLAFTVHTYADRRPLENVVVMSCVTGELPRVLCESNARGRCVINSQQRTRLNSGSILVRAKAHAPQQVQGPFESGSNIRTNLKPGRFVSFLATFNNYSSLKPAPSMAFSINGLNAVVESNACGFTYFQAAKNSNGSYKAHITSDSLSPTSQDHVIEELDSDLAKIELSPKHLDKPTVAVIDVKPGADLEQVDASRFLTLVNRERITKEIEASLQKVGVATIHVHSEPSVNQDTTGLSQSTTKMASHETKPELVDRQVTHYLSSYVLRTLGGLHLGVTLKSRSGDVISNYKAALDTASDVQQRRTIDEITKLIALSISRNEQPDSIPQPPLASAKRWVAVTTEPKSIGVNWADGTMRLQIQDVPIEIGASTSVIFEAPPGYLNLELRLNSSEKWVDLTGESSLKFARDYVTHAVELTNQGNLEDALKSLESIEVSHPQYSDAVILRAILQANRGDVEPVTLESIASLPIQENSPPEDIANKVSALSALASRDSLSKESRLSHCREILAITEAHLTPMKGFKREDVAGILLIQNGVAKGIIASLNADSVMAADSEADLKEYLKITESLASQPRTRYLRIVATKSLRSLDLQ